MSGTMVWRNSSMSSFLVSVVVMATLVSITDQLKNNYILRRRRQMLEEEKREDKFIESMNPYIAERTISTKTSDFLHYNLNEEHMKEPLKIVHNYPQFINYKNDDFRIRRSFDPSESEPVCPVIGAWQKLSTAIDINGIAVELVQDPSSCIGEQYFYVVTCQEQCPCRGVDRRRYNSRCTQEYSYAIAIVYSPSNRNVLERRTIQYQGRCTCHISPEYN